MPERRSFRESLLCAIKRTMYQEEMIIVAEILRGQIPIDHPADYDEIISAWEKQIIENDANCFLFDDATENLYAQKHAAKAKETHRRLNTPKIVQDAQDVGLF